MVVRRLEGLGKLDRQVHSINMKQFLITGAVLSLPASRMTDMGHILQQQGWDYGNQAYISDRGRSSGYLHMTCTRSSQSEIPVPMGKRLMRLHH